MIVIRAVGIPKIKPVAALSGGSVCVPAAAAVRLVQMPFSYISGFIIVFLQHIGYANVVFTKLCVYSRLAVCKNTVLDGKFARHKTSPMGRANGVCAVGAVEHKPALGKHVDIGSYNFLVINANSVPSPLIGKNID